ncbi:hypothetical protein SDRG_02428 [Saprolegnia diclina VS20]|uniref:Uncharacterized protein n=1 Tax=Saprolegnia diclina (strain VS20) TaxID=1156394 RepID=T0S623_SAPDV|nr:hypothetical protein SDRG_02428 [Saprolegnia diclina VS20]EQC40538.1 hypothetical protein SDRG_02428 [Saprolegnia diclina VS20]|eukprot:XP_008606237.1 hypothetical protein SDRG_02428 [Saprolegnia diclina VS20]
MTAVDVALRQAGLVRVMASYQDGIPLALTRLSSFWKHQVTFAPGGFFNLGFNFTIDGSSTVHSGSDLYLDVVDRRFPWHWAMRVGDDDACLAWGEFFKAELVALDASNELSVACAVRYDRPIVVKWLLDQAMDHGARRVDADCTTLATVIGRLDLLQYLHAAFPTAVQEVVRFHFAIRSASVPMLRFVYDHVGARPSQADLLKDAYSHNVDILDVVLSMLDPADASTLVQLTLRTQQGSPAMQLLFDRSRRLGLNVAYSAAQATTDGSISRDAFQPPTPSRLRPDTEAILHLADDRERWNNALQLDINDFGHIA